MGNRSRSGNSQLRRQVMLSVARQAERLATAAEERGHMRQASEYLVVATFLRDLAAGVRAVPGQGRLFAESDGIQSG